MRRERVDGTARLARRRVARRAGHDRGAHHGSEHRRRPAPQPHPRDRRWPAPRRFVATVLPTADIAILSMADEAAVRMLAREHGVPVPEVVAVCLDESVLGGQFFVSEFLEGETIPRRLLRLVADAGIGQHVVEQLGDVLGRLHAIDPAAALPALAAPAAPVAAALDGVTAAIGQLLQPEPAFVRAALVASAPSRRAGHAPCRARRRPHRQHHRRPHRAPVDPRLGDLEDRRPDRGPRLGVHPHVALR
ncbi:MAG: phosphotransferase [Ilumatobacteraceae bacterium]